MVLVPCLRDSKPFSTMFKGTKIMALHNYRSSSCTPHCGGVSFLPPPPSPVPLRSTIACNARYRTLCPCKRWYGMVWYGMVWYWYWYWAGRKLLCGGGGGVTRKPIFPTPPHLLGRRDRAGVPDLLCRGGGGVNPTSMAQNDTHVALIMLTTQMWGGGGGIIGGKNFFGPNFVFLRLRRQQPFLHKTKGPTWNPISLQPPPSFGGRPCHPPQSKFQVALLLVLVWYGMVWYGMVRYGTVRYSMVWYGMVRYSTVRYGMVRYGTVRIHAGS